MKQPRLFLILVALLGASVTVNVGLGAYTFKHLSGSAPAAAARVEGTTAAPIVARNDAGQIQTVDFLGKKTVIYVLSPNCGWCARNTKNITALWQQRRTEYQFVGLSTTATGLQEYLRMNPLPFSVITAEGETLQKYGRTGTPSTIVVSEGGIILKKWNGAFARSLPAVEKYFGVRLPGISDAQETTRTDTN